MRTVAETSEVHVHLRNLALQMKQNAFDGSRPINVFGFLSRFVNEVDMLRMSEAQAFIALLKFMSDTAETNFRTSLGGTSRQGGVDCLPEAMQHLLRTYNTPEAMHEAMDNLRSIRKGDTETEETYRKQFHDAINRFGNVQNEGREDHAIH